MHGNSPRPQVYRFGRFQVDPSERLLRREGSVVPLAPKAVETLIALLEAGGRLVSKDELMQRVWPGTFVEEANLTNQVSALRKALGGEPGGATYIETVPRRGYRFAAPIVEPGGIIPGDKAPDATRGTGRRSVVVAALAGVLLTTVVAGVWVSSRADRAVTAAPLRIARFTTTGQVRHAAISPDGKHVAYAEQDGDVQGLSIREVRSGSRATVVPNAPTNYLGMTFSPDGRFIYYVVREPDLPRQGALYRAAALGTSAPQLLLTGIDTPIAFSPDGARIAYVTSDELAGTSAIMVANPDGTLATQVASRTRPEEFSWIAAGPAWTPRGRSLITAAIGVNAHGRYASLIEVPLAGGAPNPLGTARFAEVGRLAWLADGSGFIMAGSERLSENQLWHVEYPGGDVRQITNDGSKNYAGVSMTADGTLLATVQRDPQSSVWLARDGDMTRARQISAGKHDGRFGLSWTPDGRIIYHSMESGNEDIWVMNTDGSGRTQLTHDPAVDERPVVAPDGRIVFASRRSGDFHIWRTDADGRNQVQLTRGIGDVNPDVSPDGRWVVYSSLSRGKPTLWRVPLDGGEPAQLTQFASTFPSISPDGTLVATRFRDNPDTEGTLAIVRLSDGTTVKVFDEAASGSAREFQWTAQGLTYVRTVGGVSNIWSQPPDGGPVRQLTHFNSGRVGSYRWSRDGRSLVLARGTMNNDAVLISDVAGAK